MRIAIISQPLDLLVPPYENSVGTWTNQIAKQLARSNPVTVFSKRSRLQQTLPSQPNLKYVFVASLPNKVVNRFSNLFDAWKLPAYARQYYYLDYILPIAFQIRRERFDIIHVHNYSQFVPVLRWLNPQAKIVLHMSCNWLSQLDYDAMNKRIRTTDLVLGVNEHISNAIRDRYPHHAAVCKTCYSGVDVELFSSEKSRLNKRAESQRILFVGPIEPEKGIHDLIEAFCDIADQFPDVELDIIGPSGTRFNAFIVGSSTQKSSNNFPPFHDNQYEFHLKQLVPYHLQNRVHFLNDVPQHQIVNYYHQADILVNPSYDESFGVSLIEAMASEIPVVTTCVGGMNDIVEREQNGLIVERGHIQQLSEALQLLLIDEGLRAEMGKNGRFAATNYFSWSQIAQELRIEYEQLSYQPS